MKINQKLILSYLVFALLIVTVGYFSIINSKQIGENLTNVEKEKIPAVMILLDMKAASRQASIKAIEYSLRGNEKNKKKTAEALEKIDAHLKNIAEIEDPHLTEDQTLPLNLRWEPEPFSLYIFPHMKKTSES